MKTLTQDDILREQYEAREKARRDALSWKSAIKRSQQEAERAQQEVQRLQKEVVTSHDKGLLLGQIQLCQQILKRSATPEDQLEGMTIQQLQQMAARLRQEVTGQDVSGNGSSTS